MTAGSEPWHGTYGGYSNHGCRCPRCKRAKRDATRAYRVRGEQRAVPDATECAFCGDPLPQERHSGGPRKYCSRCCYRLDHRRLCECGKPIDRQSERCACCAQLYRTRETREKMQRLWAEGRTVRQIAAAVGWKPASVGVYVCEHRELFPYRRGPQQVANIRAGYERWRAAA